MSITAREQAILETDCSLGEVSREEARKFPSARGARLSRGLYRTESEHRNFISAGLALQLPGQSKQPS
jgi:hypothetical protein